MHLSACMWADEKVEVDVAMIAWVGQPIRLSHGVLAQRLKSSDEVLRFAIDRTWFRDVHMQALLGLLRPWSHGDDCIRVGFIMEADTAELRRLVSDSPVVLQQDELSESFLDWVFCAMSRCLKGHMCNCMVYPQKFAMVLSDSAEEQAIALEEFKADWRAWKACEALAQGGNRFWAKVCERSCFGWTIVKETFQGIEANFGCEGAAEGMQALRSQVMRLHSHLGTTLMVENTFQKAADHVERDTPGESIMPLTLWRRPVQEQILSKQFGFPEVSPVDCPTTVQVDSESLPASLHRPHRKAASIPLKSITGEQTWATFSGQSMQVIAADLPLIRRLHEQGQLAQAQDTWRGSFIRRGLLLQYETEHFFCLGTWYAVVMLVTATLTSKYGRTYVSVSPTADVLCKPVLDFAAWAVIETQLVHPLR